MHHRIPPSSVARLRATALAAATALLWPAGAGANPQGGRVVAGQAQIQGGAGQLQVHQQSQRAVIDWRSFSIQAGEHTRFNLPGAGAAVLNRVTGGDPSRLMGRLSSNGAVFLLNPNGVLVGPNGVIDTGAFVASTLGIGNDAFMAGGDLAWSGPSLAGVVNLGQIRAATGDVVLLAHTVRNEGTVSAPLGTAALGAGTSILLKASGDERIYVNAAGATGSAARGVDNAGVMEAAQAELKAAGTLYALAVNSAGVVRATGVLEQGGRIVLTAAQGAVQVSGTLAARAADGSGGTVQVGGGWRGQDASVAHAASVHVKAGAVIDVDGTAQRNAGRAVVWSDGLTRFDGRITAQGLRGGDAEVSGKDVAITGSATLLGSGGAHGTLLLDPTDLTVAAGNSPHNGTNSTVGAAWVTQQLVGGNLVLDATNSLTVSEAVTWNGPTRLTLQAPTINVNANVTGFSTASRLDLLGTQAQLNATIGAGDVHLRGATALDVQAGSAGRINASNTLWLTGVRDAQLAQAVLKTPRVEFTGTSGQRLDIGNTANEVGALGFNGGEDPAVFSGVLRVATTQALALSGQAEAASVAVNTDGNLTLSAGARLTSAGSKVLASDAQFVNNAGATAFAGAGRNIVYSRSEGSYNGTAFNAGGLAYTQHPGSVKYPADPAGAGDVFYFAGLPVTVVPWSLSRYYGTADPAFGFSASGLDAGDALNGVAIGHNAAALSPVGDYGLYASGGTSALGRRYDITHKSTIFRIAPLPLQMKVSNGSRYYGDPETNELIPGFFAAPTVAGVVLPTTADVVLQGPGPLAAPGNYRVTATLREGFAKNFVLDLTPGFLSVLPAPLTLQATSGQSTYLDAVPGFSVGISGFKNGDTAASVGILGASVGVGARQVRYSASPAPAPAAGTLDAGSHAVGDFNVVTADGTAASLSPNYTLRTVAGTLTVDKRPVNITLPALTRHEDSPVPGRLPDRSAPVSNTTGSAACPPGFVCMLPGPEYLEQYVSSYSVDPIGYISGNGGGGSVQRYDLRSIQFKNPNYTVGTVNRANAYITVLARQTNEQILAGSLQNIRYDLIDPFKPGYGTASGADESSFNRYIFSDGSLGTMLDQRYTTTGTQGLFGQQSNERAYNIFGLTHAADGALLNALLAFCKGNAAVCATQNGMTADTIRNLYQRMMGDLELRGKFLPYLTAETVRIANTSPRTPAEQALLNETEAFIRRTQENAIVGVLNDIAAFQSDRAKADAWMSDIKNNTMAGLSDFGKALPADMVKDLMARLSGMPGGNGKYEQVIGGLSQAIGGAAGAASAGALAGLPNSVATQVLNAVFPHMRVAANAAGSVVGRFAGPLATVAATLAAIAEAASGFDRERKLSQAIKKAYDVIDFLKPELLASNSIAIAPDGNALFPPAGTALLAQYQAMMLAQR